MGFKIGLNNIYFSDLWLLCLCEVVFIHSVEKTDSKDGSDNKVPGKVTDNDLGKQKTKKFPL